MGAPRALVLLGLAAVECTPGQRASAFEPECTDQAPECAAWASRGECDANAKYMKVQCAASCRSCEWADPKRRCALDPDAISAVAPGDIEAMFTRAATSPDFAAYEPRVLSRDPWVLVLDRFLSEAEADAIVAVANREGGRHFGTSQDTRRADTSETSDRRTSSTQWCAAAGCANESAVVAMRARVEAITGVPQTNSEPPQLLRYFPGESYALHHDYIAVQRELPCGVRVYTAFVYLSDVEAGGTTDFPQIAISVAPRKGRLLLWPSTLSERPDAMDVRTLHRAAPVERGVKYSANIWVHSHDFMSAAARACVGGVPSPPPSVSAEPEAAAES